MHIFFILKIKFLSRFEEKELVKGYHNEFIIIR